MTLATFKKGGIASRYGGGTAIAQYGELFQGMIQDADGTLHRCLVSLPCSKLQSSGRFVASDNGGVTVMPPAKQKSRRAAEITLELLGAPSDGLLMIESNIPEGKGLGSSTADCIAAVISVAAALGRSLTPEQVAETVVRAEIASGNVMFSRPVLFANREGIVLEDYIRCLPPMTVLGFDTEIDRLVETLSFPPAAYSFWEIENFKVLTAALRRAIKEQDTYLLGRVATASAAINQRFLPKPLFSDLCKIVDEARALGVAVAHSGTVAGVLLDSRDAKLEAKIDLLKARLGSLGIETVMEFST